MNDRDFNDLLRRSDPAREVHDQRTDSEIHAAVAMITRRERPAGRVPSWPWIALPAAAVLVTLAFVVANLWQPSAPAAAATPVPLQISPTQERLGDVMNRVITLAHAQPQGGDRQRRASYEGWYLQTDVESDGSRSVIAPQEHSLTWTEALAGKLTVTAGEPYVLRGDEAVPAPTTSSTPAGTVLVEDEYAEGQMPVLFTTPPPTDVEALRAYLAQGVGGIPADAVGYLNAIRVFQSEWTPSAAVRSAMLELLRDSDALELAGEVTDRLGRPGYALRATSADSPHFEYVAVVSRESGSIIALETLYVGGLAELDVPDGSVIDYIAWK